MHPAIILDSANVFFAGLLAGIEFVSHYGFRAPAEVLDDQSQLRFRQALVLRLRILVPAFFLPTTVTAVAVTVLNGSAPGVWYRYIGILALLIWIATRVVGTVSVNSATLDWQPASPPSNWKARIAHAERFHIVGVWAAIASFACFLIAMVLKLSTT